MKIKTGSKGISSRRERLRVCTLKPPRSEVGGQVCKSEIKFERGLAEDK